MPFKGSRGPVLIIVIIFFVIIAGIAIASQGPPKSKVTLNSETVTITINYNVGIKTIEITNQNTGQTYTATVTSLPYSFNCTRGNAIDITVTTNPSYKWNAWTFTPVGIPLSDNPATFKADNTNHFGAIINNNQIIMEPNCIHISASPSPTPAPTNATSVVYNMLVVK